MKIENVGKTNEEISKVVESEFNKYAEESGVTGADDTFAFVAKDKEEVIGVIAGYLRYDEVHIGTLVVKEQYRKDGIGSKLMKELEDFIDGKGFEKMTVDTYAFQAPEFYERFGFKVECIREGRANPKLTKYFFIKYL